MLEYLRDGSALAVVYCTCRHTEREIMDHSCYLTYSQNTNSGPTCPCADLTMAEAGQDSLKSTDVCLTCTTPTWEIGELPPCFPPLPPSLSLSLSLFLSLNRLLGLVKVSASRAADLGSNPESTVDLFPCRTSDLKIDTLLTTLPAPMRYMVSAGIGRPSVSIL